MNYTQLYKPIKKNLGNVGVATENGMQRTLRLRKLPLWGCLTKRNEPGT